MERRAYTHDIIVIGGSTGATAPLKGLLAGLPIGLNASVFIVTHIGARGPGILATVASAIERLPVKQARDGMRIEPGHVYVPVPDYHLLLSESGLIRLGQGPRENLVRPAIDALFRSAAAAFGSRVIGVVLSGMLNDGAAGLEAIKRCGGLAMVQAPRDAIAPEMPRNALLATAVDVTAPATELGEALLDMIGRPAGPGAQIPADIRLEVAIAAGERADSEIMQGISEPTALTCPWCGGVLSAVRHGKLLRFRCQIGHAMTAERVAKQQAGRVDQALQVALRVIEERIELVTRLADDSRASGRHAVADIYAARLADYRGYANILRRALILSMPPGDSLSGEDERNSKDC